MNRPPFTRNRATCLEGGPVHAHHGTGLDVRDDQLVTTRRCVWCQQEQDKPYGAGGRKPWRTVQVTS